MKDARTYVGTEMQGERKKGTKLSSKSEYNRIQDEIQIPSNKQGNISTATDKMLTENVLNGVKEDKDGELHTTYNPAGGRTAYTNATMSEKGHNRVVEEEWPHRGDKIINCSNMRQNKAYLLQDYI